MFSFQEAFGSPMVVNDLYSLCAAVVPYENDAPLFVDSEAVKTFQISCERLEPVTGRGSQSVQRRRGVEHVQLSYRRGPDLCRNAPRLTGIAPMKQVLSSSVTE